MSNTSKQQKLKLSMARVKEAKRNLRHLLANGYSLRKIAAKLGGAVTFQTLGRFANEKDYIPADENVRAALGLLVPPNPYRSLPRWYERIPEALAYFNGKREQIKFLSAATKRPELWKV